MRVKVIFLGLLSLIAFALLFLLGGRFNLKTESTSVSTPSKKGLNSDGLTESHAQSKKAEQGLRDEQTWEELCELQREAYANLNKEWALLAKKDPKVKELRTITKNFQRYLQDEIREKDHESLSFWRKSEEKRELMNRYRDFSLVEAFSAMRADEFWEPYMDDYFTEVLNKRDVYLQNPQVSGFPPWTRPAWFVDEAVLETMRDTTQFSSQTSEELQAAIPADIVAFLDDVLTHRLAYEAAKYLLNKEKTTAIRNAEDRFYALSAQLDELAEITNR